MLYPSDSLFDDPTVSQTKTQTQVKHSSDNGASNTTKAALQQTDPNVEAQDTGSASSSSAEEEDFVDKASIDWDDYDSDDDWNYIGDLSPGSALSLISYPSCRLLLYLSFCCLFITVLEDLIIHGFGLWSAWRPIGYFDTLFGRMS